MNSLTLTWSPESRWPSYYYLIISDSSVYLETHTHAIHLSVHVVFIARAPLLFVLLWGLTSLCIWRSILDPPPVMHSTHSHALTCYFSQHTPRVSLCPHGNLYLPHLTVGEAGLFLAAAVGFGYERMKWVTMTEKQKCWGLRAPRRLNNFSDLEAVSFGDTWAQWSVCLQLLREYSAQHMSCSYYRPCGQNSSHNTSKSNLILIALKGENFLLLN